MAIASSVHASPGTFALLLGSGVSTGAGIPTGWQVATDLTARAATLLHPEDPKAAEAATADPASWWAENGDGPFGYSTLLGALAPTAAARQSLLAGYFEPTEGDRESGLKVPSAAHMAIARLVQRGFFRVILTTNFDRLMERALEEVGVSPQVVHRVDQISASTPLAHTRATVVKLHGDQADLDQRNTVDELSAYPDELAGFLDRVLDEYGLVVTGWSGDWDPALVAAIERVGSRRYPMAWATLGDPSETASRLIAQHEALVVKGVTGDEFFTDLELRLDALDRLSQPPLSRDMAVARLKRALPDPTRRIELFDLLEEETNAVVGVVSDIERFPLGNADYEALVDAYRAEVDTLLHLLAQGVYHDDGTHDALWSRVIQSLMNVRGSFTGGFNEAFEALRHLPALLAVWVSGIAAIAARRESTLAAILVGPSWRSMFGDQHEQFIGEALNPNLIMDAGGINAFPRWGSNRWIYPQSHYLRDVCRAPLEAVVPDDDSYRRACDRLEYLMSMVQMQSGEPDRRRGYPWAGEFASRDWGGPTRRELGTQIESEIGPSWPLVAEGVFDGPEAAGAALASVEEWIARNPRW